MATPFRPRKVIPDSVYAFREKHWPAIRKLEQISGSTLRIVVAVKAIVEAHEKKLGKPRKQARAIATLFSELTDEMLRQKLTQKGWNETYIDVLKHFWAQMPRELRKEIIRQIKEE